MLNPNDVTKKSNTQADETKNVIKDFPTDDKTIKEELKEYSDARQADSIIEESHRRATHLMSDSSLAKMDDLVNYISATYGLNSEFTKDMDKREVSRARTLTKGTRSKILNFALQHFLDTFEQQEGLIPETEHKRFKVNGKNHNAYRFTKDGVTYLIEQDQRGRELFFMSTETDSIDDINNRFDEIEDTSIKTGRPSKRDNRYV